MEKYLVTGGAGFIGSNLALELEKLGNEVVVLDNFSFGHRENLENFMGEILEIDLSKSFNIRGGFDAIFHQAAITDPRYPDDKETLRQNVGGFKSIINLAKRENAKLIYASTASLYGNGPAPQKEDQEKELLSAYAKSKFIMDEMAIEHFDNMHIVGLRYFNVFGPKESHKGKSASMIYHLGKQIKEGKNPRLFKWGTQKRDHIYVQDCVLANLNALKSKSGIYNVGTGIGTSFNDLVKIINSVLKTDLKIEYFDMAYNPKTYQNHTQADTTKSEKELGFKAQYSLGEGIKEYFKIMKWD